MATKKAAANSTTVDVSVPVGPTEANAIYRAAVNAAREQGDELPLISASNFDFEVVGEPSAVKDGARTYKVKILWEEDQVEEQAAAVPAAAATKSDA